jgi:hypothetical protein
MKRNPSSKRTRSSAKSVLRLPDMEHAKAAVLNSLNSADPLMIALASSRILELGARLWKGC